MKSVSLIDFFKNPDHVYGRMQRTGSELMECHPVNVEILHNSAIVRWLRLLDDSVGY
jgi:hypothetical protein